MGEMVKPRRSTLLNLGWRIGSRQRRRHRGWIEREWKSEKWTDPTKNKRCKLRRVEPTTWVNTHRFTRDELAKVQHPSYLFPCRILRSDDSKRYYRRYLASRAYLPKHHKAQHGIFAKSVKLVSGGQMSRMNECCVGIEIIIRHRSTTTITTMADHSRRRRKCPPTNAPHEALRPAPSSSLDGRRIPRASGYNF